MFALVVDRELLGQDAYILTEGVAVSKVLTDLEWYNDGAEAAADAFKAAFAAARGPKEISIIHGAGHLLREPGILEEVAKKSAERFQRHTKGARRRLISRSVSESLT